MKTETLLALENLRDDIYKLQKQGRNNELSDIEVQNKLELMVMRLQRIANHAAD